jgi:isoleucyl-tRNA synthetase
MDLKSTLNLPNADFTIPMKADLPQREPAIQARWDEIGVYHVIQDARDGAPTFVLHDGPAYTNSPLHMGHVLNKTLKDLVVKSRTMMGYRCPFVPGFDNHGLPIEQAVTKRLAEEKKTLTPVEFRRACRAHAERFVQIQGEQSRRLGLFGLWERPYQTMDPRFEAAIIRVFARLVEGGYVYKGLRPTLWSPTSRTALADTEIVYKEYTSRAIYVRFPLLSDPNRLFERYDNVATIIWTTTPWTIPANLAVAFHPTMTYAVVHVGDHHYIVLDSLVDRLAETFGWIGHRVVERLDGINLDHASFRHPLFDRPSLAVIAEYVTDEDGTGVVHTAPGHGRDDFATGMKYGLPILCPVDEKGVLTDEAGEFSGLFYKKCDTAVVDRLAQEGALLKAYDYVHSYPHAERDDQPVIFRATEQWYVSIDHEELRHRMIEHVREVRWVPSHGQNRIEAMVSGRPDWCISRQRPWGVGLPIFYGLPSRTPVLDPVAIEAVAQLVEREGSDAWFEREAHEILPHGYRHPETGEAEFVKETDVLDVWFDSGSTSLAVLEGTVYPEWRAPWPADLYLEGSDQHRGWFNSSLVIGTAARGSAPYKAVVTHGFVNDEKGMKMSKRLGNYMDPMEMIDRYGADVLRYWVASVDYENDVPCSEALLKQFGEAYRTVRNTLRFLLANLEDYDGGQPDTPLPIDEWVVEQADLLCAEVAADEDPEREGSGGAYHRYDFHAAITAIHNFCRSELSAVYLDAIKDRMYCERADSPVRRSAQWACHAVLDRLVRLIAPVLPHTAEEVYERIPHIRRLATVHADRFLTPDQERLEAIEANDLQVRFAALLETRAEVFALFETWKATSGIKDSQDAIFRISTDAQTAAVLLSFEADLPILFKASWVEVDDRGEGVSFRESPYLKCERCRLRRPDVEMIGGVALSARDRRVLGL